MPKNDLLLRDHSTHRATHHMRRAEARVLHQLYGLVRDQLHRIGFVRFVALAGTPLIKQKDTVPRLEHSNEAAH
jgi:hypothetical protein